MSLPCVSGPGHLFASAALCSPHLAPKAAAHQSSGWQFLAGTCGWAGAVSANTEPRQVYSKLFPSKEEYIIYDSIFLSVWRAFIKSIRELIRSLLFFHYLPKPWCIYATQTERPPVNGIRSLE